MLFQRNITDAERDEFFTQLNAFRERTDPGAEAEFASWWASWLISIRLHTDEDYRLQAKESLTRYRNGDGGTPVDAEGLRQRFNA